MNTGWCKCGERAPIRLVKFIHGEDAELCLECYRKARPKPPAGFWANNAWWAYHEFGGFGAYVPHMKGSSSSVPFDLSTLPPRPWPAVLRLPEPQPDEQREDE